MEDFEKNQELKKQVQAGVEEGIELNHLKKINKKISILHTIIFIIFFIVPFLFLILFFKYNQVNNVINNAYDQLEKLSQYNNYKLTYKENYFNFQTEEMSQSESVYFYKDGNYKVEFTVRDNNTYKEIPYHTTQYFNENNTSSIMIFHNLETIENRNFKYIEQKKGGPFKIFSNIYQYATLNNFSSIYVKLGLSLRTESYDGKECYVIKTQSNNGYKETWITKGQFYTIRQVETIYDLYYKEEKYDLILDKTEDVDVETTNIENNYDAYEIKNISINNDTSYYNLVNEID